MSEGKLNSNPWEYFGVDGGGVGGDCWCADDGVNGVFGVPRGLGVIWVVLPGVLNGGGGGGCGGGINSASFGRFCYSPDWPDSLDSGCPNCFANCFSS